MSEVGVHSEVGRLRKVMVHRPDLSLRELTPSNHDELLFDDVLWVERAQPEHDQFVAESLSRGRGLPPLWTCWPSAGELPRRPGVAIELVAASGITRWARRGSGGAAPLEAITPATSPPTWSAA